METRINWKKIDIITYSGEYMSDECKAEVKKARDLRDYYEHIGDTKKAAYVAKKLEEKQNYVVR